MGEVYDYREFGKRLSKKMFKKIQHGTVASPKEDRLFQKVMAWEDQAVFSDNREAIRGEFLGFDEAAQTEVPLFNGENMVSMPITEEDFKLFVNDNEMAEGLSEIIGQISTQLFGEGVNEHEE